MRRWLLVGACLIIAAALGTLGGAWATGRTPRDYSVLAPSDRLGPSLAGPTAAEVAEHFRPVVLGSDGRDVGLERVAWDIEHSQDSYLLRYYLIWPTEHHPDPVLDALYGIWRSAYYGYRDIEVITVELAGDASARSITMDAAEPGKPYDTPTPKHLKASWTVSADGADYRLTDGTTVVEQGTELPPLADGRLRVCVQTWNHLITLCPGPRRADPDVGFVPLDDRTFADEKIIRRR